MTRFKKITLTAVVLTTIGAGSLAVAARAERDPARFVERIGERMELNDAQSDALLGFVEQMQTTRTLMRGAELREEGLVLLGADTLDQGAALSLLESRADALRAQAPSVVAAAALFFDGLNAEQREQVQQFAGRTGRHGHRR